MLQYTECIIENIHNIIGARNLWVQHYDWVPEKCERFVKRTTAVYRNERGHAKVTFNRIQKYRADIIRYIIILQEVRFDYDYGYYTVIIKSGW